MKKDSTIRLADDFIMHTYKRIPVVITKGKGIYLWDSDGKKYMDFLGARGAANTGYSNPDVIKAITEQAKKLILVTNDFYTAPQAELAQLITKNSFADQVFFCNSGAEANEGALKLSRLYSYKKYGQGRYVIVSANNSFHGRTYGTLSATGQKKYQIGFEPMLPGFRHVRFNDIEDLHAALGDDVCAVILEPVQGEGGIYPATKEYIDFVREQTQKRDILLIMDEVQVGLGRTGTLFAYAHYGIKPDMVTIAKSIAGGVPMGALLATKAVSVFFDYGTHGTTFGGSPLAAAAGIASINYIIKHRLPGNAKRLGALASKQLFAMKGKYPDTIKDIRGMGLAIGIEFYDADLAAKTFDECLKSGLIVNVTNGNIIRFLPPLIISEQELKKGIDIFEKAVASALKQQQVS
jgi:predicted acetylornithine/succinylornithine family transaminase